MRRADRSRHQPGVARPTRTKAKFSRAYPDAMRGEAEPSRRPPLGWTAEDRPVPVPEPLDYERQWTDDWVADTRGGLMVHGHTRTGTWRTVGAATHSDLLADARVQIWLRTGLLRGRSDAFGMVQEAYPANDRRWV